MSEASLHPDQSRPGVVVTGAAGDLGGALCDAWAAEGWAVFGADIRDPKRGGVTYVEADVRDRASVVALAERAALESALSVWVNCAGIVAAAKIREADPDVWDRIIAVNLTGTFHGCAAAMNAMIAGGRGGRIVNVGSLSGQIGGRGMHPAYGASKAGVHTLTKSYAAAGARYGIACNVVAPGVIEGSMAEGFSEDQRQKVVMTNPMRRLARMDEVVSVIRFLANAERSSYMNGAVVPINGGAFLG